MTVRVPLPKIDYTARDFEGIKEALTEYLKQRFPDDFTDFNESQLGIAIMELVAYQGSILSFMLDRMVNETYIETARERRSIIKIANLLSYELYSAVSSSVNLNLDKTELAAYTVPTGTVTISKGTVVSSGSIPFEIDQNYTIVSFTATTWKVNGVPTTDPTVGAIQGQTVVDTFTSTGIKYLSLTLSRYPFIGGSVVTTVGAVIWTLVESLVLGDPDDSTNQKIYEASIDEDDKATLKFGDGAAGEIPSTGTVIEATYRIGGGIQGNVAALSIDQSIPATHGSGSIQLRVYNAVSASGGADRESIEHARFFAPRFAKTMDRAITYNDYNSLSNGYTDGATGTVAKAGVICDNSDGLANQVSVYCWALDNSGNLSTPVGDSLRDSLKSFLNQRRVVTVTVNVLNGTNVPVDLNLLVRADPSYSVDAIEASISNSITSIFQSDQVRFGNELRLSWIIDAIQDLAGIYYVHITGVRTGAQGTTFFDPLVIEGTAQDIEKGLIPGGQSTDPYEIKLPGTSSSTDDYYCNYRIESKGQSKRIIDYDGATKIATLNDPWDATKPPTGSDYWIYHPRRIKLAAAASSTNDIYKNRVIVTKVPKEKDLQSRGITDYDGTTKIAIVDADWVGFPLGGTTTYRITPDLKVNQTKALTKGILSTSVVSQIS